MNQLVSSAFFSNTVATKVHQIVTELKRLKTVSSAADWRGRVREDVLNGPWKELAHACPITRRSFEKPRGYAGDAVILDYIYGFQGVESPPPTGISARVYEYTKQSPACRAVRYRRTLIAHLIDEIAGQKAFPNILSIAAGHLREFELSEAAQLGMLGTWIAMDQDPLSVASIERDYGARGVTAQAGSVRDIITGRKTYSGFDFIYAAGLLDYLPDEIAKRLVIAMSKMLAPGGRMMIANFMPDIFDVGYMEIFMDWHLIYRNKQQMQNLFEGSRFLPNSINIEYDPDRNIVFAIANL